MGSNMPDIAQERTGAIRPSVPPVGQGSLFTPPRPSWREFLTWLIRDPKAVGCAIFGGRDPEQARKNLDKVLDRANARHFDVEWLDLTMDHLGPEAWEHLVRFVCERAGFEMPARKPDQVRVADELADVRKTLEQVDAALRQVTKAVVRIEGGVR